MKTEALSGAVLALVLFIAVVGMYFMFTGPGKAVQQPTPLVMSDYCKVAGGNVYCTCEGAGTTGRLLNGESVFGSCDRLCNMAGQGRAMC